MGYDISYHPINRDEIYEWYFNRLDEVKAGDFSGIEAVARKYRMDDFYLQKYKDTMSVAANTTSAESFDKTHSYYLAVVQGFFRTFYYTRGTAFTFLVEQHKEMSFYTTGFSKVLNREIENPIHNRIMENYCGGVYIPYENVSKLLADYQNGVVKEVLENFFEQNLPIFLKALTFAKENQLGLLEATEVVEVNPIALNETICYSNLMNCDREGAFIYAETAKAQIESFAKSQNMDAQEVMKNAEYKKTPIGDGDKNVKKGLWKKLFGK
ncbi:hypothetical protein [Anaerocolumna sp.]|uniref:hypothetical protein n=1 Tax=Anaerocolumna sp. TaxID=2041569 RepID=UPI0028AD3E38|nr:hypothetical protein [Anaerocolumna sp.]